MNPAFEYKGYVGSAEINVVDNILHGRLLFITDLVTYAADSPKALQAAFEAAVEDYLQTCAELGDEPNIPRRELLAENPPTDSERRPATAPAIV